MQEESDNPTFRERMQQAALLPEIDPVRLAFLKQLQSGNEAVGDAQWQVLLAETESLKLQLQSVSIPNDLITRLLAIPDSQAIQAPAPSPLPFYKRPLGELLTLGRLSIAAALILVIAAGWWAIQLLGARQQAGAIEHVALLAEDIHKSLAAAPPGGGGADRIDTSDPKAAEAWLKTRVSFPAIMLSAPNVKLTGAAVVKLANAPAALTRWQRDGHSYSLFEFLPQSLNLPPDFAQQTRQDPSGAPYKMILWTDSNKGCAWVLVMDQSAPSSFTY